MKNETKFTPGPWFAVHSGFGDATVIAKCGWKNKDGSDYIPTIMVRESWPTARLIAAAPEMLEALQYLIQGRPGEAQFDRLYETRVNAARMAISKALGEEVKP